MLAGFANDGSPQLYLNDPAGTYSAWKVHHFTGNWFIEYSSSHTACTKVKFSIKLIFNIEI